MTALSTLNPTAYRARIHRDGFAVVEGVLSPERVEGLRAAIAALPEGEEVRRRKDVYGVRNLLEISPAVSELAASTEIRGLVMPVLGPECFAVRATFFDKVPDANWKLRWHQDSVIAVKRRVDVPGFGAWSDKAGVLQVRPPEAVLAEMLAIRVHLDDCPGTNGPLRILAGTHTRRWPREDIGAAKAAFREVACEVGLGGVLAMRPLVLHASSPAEVPGHRRVIHLEFAHQPLPDGLEWKQEIGA